MTAVIREVRAMLADRLVWWAFRLHLWAHRLDPDRPWPYRDDA